MNEIVGVQYRKAIEASSPMRKHDKQWTAKVQRLKHNIGRIACYCYCYCYHPSPVSEDDIHNSENNWKDYHLEATEIVLILSECAAVLSS